MPMFERYIGVDYSGAGDPTERARGLRVFEATPSLPPTRCRAGKTLNWSRRELAEWLGLALQEAQPTIVGLDHGFSFPKSYFSRYSLETWDAFLDDFVKHWPTNQQSVESLRRDNPRSGHATELRLCERWTSSAKSVFLFGVQGTVANSTHSGLSWLHALRRANRRIHFWPFDGWKVATDASVVVEVYPSLFRRRYERVETDSDDDHDARSICMWLRDRDALGSLDHYFQPALSTEERSCANVEGWILGLL